MATFFASFIAWHNCSIATHFFQEFDGDDDDYDYYDDDYENLSGDASIIWDNWLYQGHLLKDDEQEALQEEALALQSKAHFAPQASLLSYPS